MNQRKMKEEEAIILNGLTINEEAHSISRVDMLKWLILIAHLLGLLYQQQQSHRNGTIFGQPIVVFGMQCFLLGHDIAHTQNQTKIPNLRLKTNCHGKATYGFFGIQPCLVLFKNLFLTFVINLSLYLGWALLLSIFFVSFFFNLENSLLLKVFFFF